MSGSDKFARSAAVVFRKITVFFYLYRLSEPPLNQK